MKATVQIEYQDLPLDVTFEALPDSDLETGERLVDIYIESCVVACTSLAIALTEDQAEAVKAIIAGLLIERSESEVL